MFDIDKDEASSDKANENNEDNTPTNLLREDSFNLLFVQINVFTSLDSLKMSRKTLIYWTHWVWLL
jgi:hypothetical protein